MKISLVALVATMAFGAPVATLADDGANQLRGPSTALDAAEEELMQQELIGWDGDIVTTLTPKRELGFSWVTPGAKIELPDDFTILEMLRAEVDAKVADGGYNTVQYTDLYMNVALQIFESSPYGNATREEEKQLINDMLPLFDANSTEKTLAYEYYIEKATNRTVCEEIPGACNTDAHAAVIREFIRERLRQIADKGEVPVLNDLLFEVKDTFGLSYDDIYELFKSHPAMERYIKQKVDKLEKLGHKNHLWETALDIADAFEKSARNPRVEPNLTAALEPLGMEVSDAMDILSNFPKLAKRVKTKVKNAIKKIEDAEHQRLRNYDAGGTYVVEDEGNTTSNIRRLRWVPGPDFKGIEHHEKKIKEFVRRRRLESEKILPKDTSDFERRLDDHFEELHGHVRELLAVCNSNLCSSADRLDALAVQMKTASSSLKPKLSPVNTLLDQIKTAQGGLYNADETARLVFNAIKLGANIPGLPGQILKKLKNFMTPVQSGLETLDSKVTTYQNSVGNAWKNSFGKVETLIDSFDSGKVYYAVQAIGFAASISQSQCATFLIDTIANANVFGEIEKAVTVLKDYIEALVAALDALSNILSSQAWLDIKNPLGDVVAKLAPINAFFAPFDPLRAAMQTRITIRPWIAEPYTTRRAGGAACPWNHEYVGWNRAHCFERVPWGWQNWAVDEIKKSCGPHGMADALAGDCYKPGYVRPRRTWRCWWDWFNSGCSCDGWHWIPGDQCVEGCHWGYTADLWMCRSGCPGHHGFWDNWWGNGCHSPVRAKGKQRPVCGHHSPTVAGAPIIFDTVLEECWQKCAHGHSEVLGTCWKPAELVVSVEGIMNVFNSVVGALTSLDIVQTVLNVIDTLINAIPGVKPIFDLIENFIKNAMQLPIVPTINLDSLPLSAFNSINVQMPPIPDLNPLSAVGLTAFEDFGTQLPAPFDSITTCKNDPNSYTTCLMNALGVGNLVNAVMDPIESVMNTIADFKTQIEALIPSITCSQWGTRTIPTSQVLSKIGINSFAKQPVPVEKLEIVGIHAPGLSGSWRASGLIDGDKSLHAWNKCPFGWNNVCPAQSWMYIQADLGQVKSLSKVKVWGVPDGRLDCNLKVELSETGADGTWKTVYDTGAGWGPPETEAGLEITFEPTNARYIRHRRGRSNVGHYAHFVEIEAYGRAHPPRKLNIVSASSGPGQNFDGWRANNLINGDKNPHTWSSCPRSTIVTCDTRSSGLYYQFDLGSVMNVDTVVLYAYWPDKRRYCGQIVELSTDGHTWTTVYDTGSQYGPVEMPTGNGISFQPIMARYIRHYRGRVDLGPWGPTFVELEAYGPPEIEASPDICDITVDICEKFDTSAIEAVARSMASALNPILSTITSTANGRRLLAAANGKNNFLPIIGLTIGGGMVGDQTYTDRISKVESSSFIMGRPYKWSGSFAAEKATKNEPQPVGWHYRFEPAIFLDAGVLLSNGVAKLGVEIGAKMEFKFGTTVGYERFLADSIAFARGKIAKLQEARDQCSSWNLQTVRNAQGLRQNVCPKKDAAEAAWRASQNLPIGKDYFHPDTLQIYMNTFKHGDPSLVVKRKSQEAIRYWFTEKGKVNKQLDQFDRELWAWQQPRDDANQIKARMFKNTTYTDLLMFKTEWIAHTIRNKVAPSATKGAKIISSNGMGGQPVSSMFKWGGGIEWKDNKSKTRLGPLVMSNLDGKIGKISLGEIQFKQMDAMKAFSAQDRTKWREAKYKEQLNGLGNIFVAMSLSGVLDLVCIEADQSKCANAKQPSLIG